jgi:hypothetical protein
MPCDPLFSCYLNPHLSVLSRSGSHVGFRPGEVWWFPSWHFSSPAGGYRCLLSWESQVNASPLETWSTAQYLFPCARVPWVTRPWSLAAACGRCALLSPRVVLGDTGHSSLTETALRSVWWDLISVSLSLSTQERPILSTMLPCLRSCIRIFMLCNKLWQIE